MGIPTIDGLDTGFLALRPAEGVQAAWGERSAVAISVEPATSWNQVDGVALAMTAVVETAIADGTGLAVGLEEEAGTPFGDVLVQADRAALTLDDSVVSSTGTARAADAMALAGVERSALTSDAPLGVATDQVAIAMMEAAVAGVIEDWNVPDDLTSVTGRLPWTRLAGTLMTVQGGRALLAGPTDADGLQIDRCDVDIGTSDYEVSGTLVLQPGDAGLAVTALLARIGGADTFYQARAVRWASNFVDLWRNVGGAWQRIGAVAAITPQHGDRLVFRLSGATLSVYLQGVLVVGPVDDVVDGIPTGTQAGIFAQWSGGLQARIGMDDWVARPLAFAGTPLEQGESVRMGLGERTTLAKGIGVGEALPIGVGEWPVPTFFVKLGPDSVLIGLGERLVAIGGVGQAEAVGVDLGEVGALAPPVDTFGLSLYDVGVVGTFRSGAEPVAVGLVDPQSVLEQFLVLLRPAVGEPLAVGLTEAVTPARRGLIQITGETVTVAGPTGEGIVVAGPVNEAISMETP